MAPRASRSGANARPLEVSGIHALLSSPLGSAHDPLPLSSAAGPGGDFSRVVDRVEGERLERGRFSWAERSPFLGDIIEHRFPFRK